MSASVALLGWDETPLRVVQDVDWVLDDRADSTNQLRVTTSLAEVDGVDAEQEIIFKGRRFTVADIDRDRAAGTAVIVADESQAALADLVVIDFKPNNWTLTRAMNAVLAGTRWTLGEVSGTRYGQAHFDEITALDALHFLARHQDAELSFDSLRRRVNITPTQGTTYEYVFTYGRQLSNIRKEVQQPVTTVIYPTMAEDVKLDPVEDYGYYLSQGLSLAEAKARFKKEEYWEDSRYEIAENMTRDAQKRLEEEAWPRVTYTLTAQATLDVEGVDDFDLAELRLGDTVYVWDQDTDTKLSAEVTAVTTSSDQSENELVLSTLPASLGDTVSGRGYFGDSGRPSSGGRRRSGPQPRPSMPILEEMGDYGIAVTRWNGQDHDGNYNTIPQRFGTLLTLVAPLEDGVIPSPMDSTHTFMGSDIQTRGGGTSTIGFNGYGEFAVWHQMRGWDGETMSQLSEPLVVDAPPAFDPGPLQADLEDARTRLSAAETRAQEAFDEVGQLREEWQTDFPALQQELDDAKDAVAAAETRLAAAEQSVADSAAGLSEVTTQVGYLNEERLPGLDNRLDNIEPAIYDYDARIISAQEGADQANATANTLQNDTLPALEGELVDLRDVQIPAVESTLTDTRLGMENLRDIRLPELEGTLTQGLSGLAEDAAVTRHLFVGNSDNMWLEAWHGEQAVRLYAYDPGSFQGSNSTAIARFSAELPPASTWSPSGRDGRRSWEIPADASSSSLAFRTGPGRGIPVTPGERYALQTLVRDAGDSTLAWYIQFYSKDGQQGTSSNQYVTLDLTGLDHPAGDSEGVTRTFEVPDLGFGSDGMYMVPFLRHVSGAGGIRRVAEPKLRKMVDGRIVVDGSIEARHIMAESIAAAVGQFLNLTADQIDTENLAAYLATIIELDAGQITAGKINTARLDAQEVAGAVANFLTLDALEINVEQLAGEIANIIEITAESIASGAIQARHLSIGDFENYLPDDALWDYRANGRTSPQWFSLGMEAAGWSTNTSPTSTAPIRIRWDSPGGSGTTRLGFAHGGTGMSVRPGDQIRMTCWGWRATGGSRTVGVSPRYVDENGNLVTHGDALEFGNGSQNYDQTWEVPDNGVIRRLVWVFHSSGSDPAGAGSGHWGDFKVRRMVGGELLVDGGIYARHLNAEEIFFDQAVGNTVAAGIAEFLELHAEQITSGQIDTDLLNVNDLAARVATVITLNADRITTGELGAERINVASFFTEDAFVNNLRSAVVTALEVTAERGFIGGALLEDDSITVAKLTATDEIAAELGRFLELNADQIRSNSWTGIVATGATFQTHAQANRGVKMLPAGLRGWDNSGNLKFDLSASTGDLLATGTLRTAMSGNRVEIRDTSSGGAVHFWSGNNRSAIKSRSTVGRLSMVYNDLGGNDDDLPFIGVEQNRAMISYRSQRLTVGGTSGSDQYMEFDTHQARFNGEVLMRRAARTHYTYGDSASLGYVGQRPESGNSAELEIRSSSGVRISTASDLWAFAVYDSTSGQSANVRVSTSGRLVRATSASKYKVDPRDLTAPDSILDVPLTEWIDKAELESMGDMLGKPRPLIDTDQAEFDAINLRRNPGVIAEQVAELGGEQFVVYGPDGELEEVMYDRLSLAQIQVLKRKHEALEARVAQLEGAS